MKKLLIALVVLMALAAIAVFAVLPAMVNEDALKTQLMETIKAVTGLEPTIQGKTEVKLFPTPHIIINEVGIRNLPSASAPYILSTRSLVLYPSLTELFSGGTHLERLELIDPVIELEVMQDKNLNIMTMFTNAKQSESAAPAFLNLPSIRAQNLKLRYADVSRRLKTEYQGLDFGLTQNGGGIAARLIAQAGGAPMTFDLTLSSKPGAPMLMQVEYLTSKLTLHGTSQWTGKQFDVDGQAEFTSDNLVSLITLNAPPVEGAPALPFSAASSFTYKDQVVHLTDINLTSSALKGRAELSINTSEALRFESSMMLDSMDVDAMYASGLLVYIGDKMKPQEATAQKMTPEMYEEAVSVDVSSLPTWLEDTSLAIKIESNQAIVNKQTLEAVKFSADFSRGDTVIDQATARLPGETDVVLIGILKEGYQGLTYEGSVDLSGKNFTELLPLFGIEASSLPAEDFKRFRAKANVVISPAETRLTEMQVQVESMQMAGAVIATYEKELMVDSVTRLAGINVDHLRDHWGIKSSNEDFPEQLRTWVKSLGTHFKVKASLEQFTYEGVLRPRADFQIEAQRGSLNLNPLVSEYNGTKFTLGLLVDVTKEQPHYAIRFVADKIDTTSWAGEQPAAQQEVRLVSPVSGDIWSRQEFNVDWLDNHTADIELQIAEWKHRNWLFRNFAFKGEIANREMTIDNIAAKVWDADFQAAGKIGGGRLPALSMSYALNNLSMEQVSAITPLFTGMNGRFNVSGTVVTNGNNPYSWARNASGAFGIGGRDVLVKGFNLPGIVRSVSAVRSVADILNVVRLAFPGGDTLLSTVQGKFNMADGVIRTPGVDLETNVASGVMTGEVNLLNWTINMATDFKLSSLDVKNPPSLVLLFTGDLENPKKGLDTKSLEAFVAIKSRERLLQDFPGGQ